LDRRILDDNISIFEQNFVIEREREREGSEMERAETTIYTRKVKPDAERNRPILSSRE
jgi:hypothetical protein